jgi:hypothetical protein
MLDRRSLLAGGAALFATTACSRSTPGLGGEVQTRFRCRRCWTHGLAAHSRYGSSPERLHFIQAGRVTRSGIMAAISDRRSGCAVATTWRLS